MEELRGEGCAAFPNVSGLRLWNAADLNAGRWNSREEGKSLESTEVQMKSAFLYNTGRSLKNKVVPIISLLHLAKGTCNIFCGLTRNVRHLCPQTVSVENIVSASCRVAVPHYARKDKGSRYRREHVAGREQSPLIRKCEWA